MRDTPARSAEVGDRRRGRAAHTGQEPFVPAVISALVPGLGQIYDRELGKGLALIVASLFALFSVVVLIGVVLYAIVRLCAIYDAYTVAERQSGLAEEPSPNG